MPRKHLGTRNNIKLAARLHLVPGLRIMDLCPSFYIRLRGTVCIWLSPYMNILSYRPVAGNDCDAEEITATARQRLARNGGSTVASDVFCGSSLRLYHSIDGVEVVRGLLRFSRCELLLWESGSWGTGVVRKPRVREISAVGCRYQTTTAEDGRLRTINTCCSELMSVLIVDSTIVTCSYDL
jgi:hypothetical protein